MPNSHPLSSWYINPSVRPSFHFLSSRCIYKWIIKVFEMWNISIMAHLSIVNEFTYWGNVHLVSPVYSNRFKILLSARNWPDSTRNTIIWHWEIARRLTGRASPPELATGGIDFQSRRAEYRNFTFSERSRFYPWSNSAIFSNEAAAD